MGLRPVIDDNVSIGWLGDRRHDRLFAAMAAHGMSLDILIQNPDELPIAVA